MLTNSTKCWGTFVCRLLMLGNERRMQPKSKVTRQRSEAKSSRQIRRIHNDLRAHQSIQTTSRQAITHIHNMRAHLAASRPRFGPNGHIVWPADHDCQPTMWRRPTGPTAFQLTCGSVWLVLHGGLAQSPGKWLVVPPYIYEGRGLK